MKKLAVIDDHGLEGLAIAAGQFDVKILKTLPEPILYRWFGNLDEDETLGQFNSKIKLMYNYRVKKIKDSMAANHVAFWFFPMLSLLFTTFFLAVKIPDEDKYGVTRALGVFCSLFFLIILKIPIQEEKRRDSNRQYGDLGYLGKYYSDYELLDEYATLIGQRNTLEIFFRELVGELVTIDIKDADNEQNATNKPFRPSTPAPAFEGNSVIIDIREEAPQLSHRNRSTFMNKLSPIIGKL